MTPAEAAALAPLPAYAPAFEAPAAEGWASGYTNENGARLSLAPKWMLYFNARYDHEVWSGWSGFIQGDVNFKTSYNFFANGDPHTDLPAVAIVNVSTGVHTDNGRLGVTIYCKNLTDRRVPTFRYLASDSTLTSDSLAEKPDYVQGFSPDSFREVGVTLNYRM